MRTLAPLTLALSVLAAACSTEPTVPPSIPHNAEAGRAPSLAVGPPWGPETPHFNLEAILRGDGFGLVRFRQPNDADRIVYLDVFVRGLAPNTSYRLQRAVDTNVDGYCTSTSWLTLGRGTTPEAIVTDDRGTGRAELFRNLTAAPGSRFDIHFRVIGDATSAVVLTSDCYEFTVSQ